MSNQETSVIEPGLGFEPADDFEVVQATLLSAAVNGDAIALSRLQGLQGALDEPYRTIAAVVHRKHQAGEFINRITLGHCLQSCRLTRRNSQGEAEQLTPEQVVNLLFATEVQPGQVDAYLGVVGDRLAEKRQADMQQRVANLTESFSGNLSELIAEVQQMQEQVQREGLDITDVYPDELLELIPYTERLLQQQTGSEFLGLDSGFSHINFICNGLDTGLIILAAKPGAGKTTLVWQVACQVAEAEQVPVIFVSMEQSKLELRAKVLSRFSRIQYHHILRGRLRSDNQDDRDNLLAAVNRYAPLSRHITIIEGDENTTTNTIMEVARAKMAAAGSSRCLIVVDFLQILPLRSEDSGRVNSTKDRVDFQVSALRRVARQLDSPVIAISSENRAGYDRKDLSVFKESGGIEYSADIAMVLTRSATEDPPANGEYRWLDLNVIKNRNGETGFVRFKFYPRRAEFVEQSRGQLPEEPPE